MADKKSYAEALRERAQGKPEKSNKDMLLDEAVDEMFDAMGKSDKQTFREALKQLLEANE